MALDGAQRDGPTRNPWDVERIPGGSGGGSAAALAAFEAPGIGTDTGGSIRQPASVTGTVGVKPTYGAVSATGSSHSRHRWTKRVRAPERLDAALLHEVIAGYDPRDSTSINAPVPDVVAGAGNGDIRDAHRARPRAFRRGLPAGRARKLDTAVAMLTDLGAEVVEVSCPHFDYALGAYYLILPSEASSISLASMACAMDFVRAMTARRPSKRSCPEHVRSASSR